MCLFLFFMWFMEGLFDFVWCVVGEFVVMLNVDGVVVGLMV